MSEQPKEGCGQASAAILIAVVIAPFTWALWGYATSVLWGWFVVPQFHVAAMSVPTAIGLWLVLSQFRRRATTEKDKTAMQIVLESAIHGFGNPLIALGTGAIVHRWFL